ESSPISSASTPTTAAPSSVTAARPAALLWMRFSWCSGSPSSSRASRTPSTTSASTWYARRLTCSSASCTPCFRTTPLPRACFARKSGYALPRGRDTDGAPGSSGTKLSL
ncbi:unnamed protein product, partial [Ectocarpus sp. 12 AP-2014]